MRPWAEGAQGTGTPRLFSCRDSIACLACPGQQAEGEEAQELRDIAEVLKITANTDGNIKRSMEAILRIADRLERGKGHDKGAGKTV